MSIITRNLTVPHQPAQMLDLVSDVRSYPDFVRWIRALRILTETGQEASWTGRAQVAIEFKGINESFTTDVSVDRERRIVRVDLIEGPFRRLSNCWAFKPSGTGCEIDFFIDFEFSNKVLHMLFESNSSRAISTLIGVFTNEALRRYGP